MFGWSSSTKTLNKAQKLLAFSEAASEKRAKRVEKAVQPMVDYIMGEITKTASTENAKTLQKFNFTELYADGPLATAFLNKTTDVLTNAAEIRTIFEGVKKIMTDPVEYGFICNQIANEEDPFMVAVCWTKPATPPEPEPVEPESESTEEPTEAENTEVVDSKDSDNIAEPEKKE